MARMFIRSSNLSSMLPLVCMAFLIQGRASAQQQPLATFGLSLNYTTTYENSAPAPLIVSPGDTCFFQNLLLNVTNDLIAQKSDYYSSVTITAPFDVRPNGGGVNFNCKLQLQGARQAILISSIVYTPSSGQIRAEMQATGGSIVPDVEIAYLLYVDTSIPGHYAFQFRGNDALFALAQQTFGVNFTGVELLIDVQWPFP